MKELGNGLAQLFFIIMVMITLAVSTAALSQWASSDMSAGGGAGIEQGAPPASSLSTSAAR